MSLHVAIYVCLSGLWLGGLLHLSFLSCFFKLACYAHVFPCIYLQNVDERGNRGDTVAPDDDLVALEDVCGEVLEGSLVDTEEEDLAKRREQSLPFHCTNVVMHKTLDFISHISLCCVCVCV